MAYETFGFNSDSGLQRRRVEESPAEKIAVQNAVFANSRVDMKIGLLTGCKDRPYVFGLTTALASQGVSADIIGSDDLDCPEMRAAASLRFLNFYSGYNPEASLAARVLKVLAYYALLIRYAACSSPKILHILWNNKFEYFDRTLLMLYYRALGKRITFTAHNVNQAERDATDSLLNRVTLKIQYRLCDHIFVHTEKMKEELCAQFTVSEEKVSVIKFPINNSLCDTELTSAQAKRRLELGSGEKAILFFGRIRPYKGIEYLLDAFRMLSEKENASYRLIIAGEAIKGCEQYLQEIQRSAAGDFAQDRIIWRTQFIPDDDVELYLKAADVLVLPYKEIFQSGVLFLAYAFGLPVVATDVGSFREEIVEGSTGFLCKPGDSAEMARAIETYFESGLFKNLGDLRKEIKEYANENHSWHAVAKLTCGVYAKLLEENAPRKHSSLDLSTPS